jgi:hypothetical protein
MHQLGHTDSAFTLRVYVHMMRRSPEEREALKRSSKASHRSSLQARPSRIAPSRVGIGDAGWPSLAAVDLFRETLLGCTAPLIKDTGARRVGRPHSRPL